MSEIRKNFTIEVNHDKEFELIDLPNNSKDTAKILLNPLPYVNNTTADHFVA